MSLNDDRAYIQRRNDLIAADLLKGQRRADVARRSTWLSGGLSTLSLASMG
jgi:hypothetical protein